MENQITAQKQVSYLYHLQAFTKQRPWVYNMKASWFPTMVWSMAWILLGALFLFLLNNPRINNPLFEINHFKFTLSSPQNSQNDDFQLLIIIPEFTRDDLAMGELSPYYNLTPAKVTCA